VRTPKQGYDEYAQLTGIREKKETQKWAKLYFARYLTLDGQQLAVALGTTDAAAKTTTEAKTFTDRRALLRNNWSPWRTNTFGPSTWLAKMVQHSVELDDFEVILFNLARTVRKCKIVPSSETLGDKRLRSTVAV
jgi:hypothetical protein